MKTTFQVAGKKIEMPSSNGDSNLNWKWTLRPGGWVIGESSEGRRVRFMFHQSREHVSARIEGHLWFGKWQQESRSTDSSGGSGDNDLTAQFPGKVRKILVKEGAQVGEGDPLVLVEAMKMEFAIRAPFPGKVKSVLVSEGQQILPGDRLVDLEAE